MRLMVVGPGRAGMALAIAATAAGHEVAAVVGRSRDHATAAAARLATTPLGVADALPDADLLVIAVRDDAIAPVAARLAGVMANSANLPVRAAVHVSGLAPLSTLLPLGEAGVQVGSFHPLQTLPDPERGAAKLAGAWIGITAEGELLATLEDLASSLGSHPFRIADDAKAVYHAAAAAAANFPLAAWTIAADLFTAAGVPFEAARPLVEAVVTNAFEIGPRAALTGPVARGDVATVAAQLAAVDEVTPEWGGGYRAFVHLLAKIAGREETFTDLMDGGAA